MAQPKRRWSKARTHLKRSTWKVEKPTFEEVDEALTCEHNFMPVDSTGLTLACIKCGFVVKRDKDN